MSPDFHGQNTFTTVAIRFAKIYGRKNVTISLQVSLTKSNKGATLTPFVKRQVLVANLKHKIACKFCKFLSVKLAKIGHENIWSVKVGVHLAFLQRDRKLITYLCFVDALHCEFAADCN